MSDVALITGRGAWRRLAEACRQFLLAVAEGFAAARRYRRLLTLSAAELRQLGITRQDQAWYFDALAAAFAQRAPGPMADELRRVVDEVFGPPG